VGFDPRWIEKKRASTLDYHQSGLSLSDQLEMLKNYIKKIKAAAGEDRLAISPLYYQKAHVVHRE
jgi:hypothetical protein